MTNDFILGSHNDLVSIFTRDSRERERANIIINGFSSDIRGSCSIFSSSRLLIQMFNHLQVA